MKSNIDRLLARFRREETFAGQLRTVVLIRRAVERQNEDAAKKAGLPADFASVHPEKPSP